MNKRVLNRQRLLRHGVRLVLLGPVVFPLLAASPTQRGLTLELPVNPLLASPSAQVPAGPPTGFAPAPLPNRDLEAPLGPRASTDPSVAPGLFTRSDTYRGEGFSKGSTPQAEQEKRVKPGAGFNLKVPFAPN